MEGLKILSDEFQRVIIETEDTKEILAEITNKEIKSANNIQIRIMPTYDGTKIKCYCENKTEGSIEYLTPDEIKYKIQNLARNKRVEEITILYKELAPKESTSSIN